MQSQVISDVALLACSETEDAGHVPQLYINQFAPSTLDWKEQSLKLQLEAHFYRPDKIAMARLEILSILGPSSKDSNPSGLKVELKLRIPAWAKADGCKVILQPSL